MNVIRSTQSTEQLENKTLGIVELVARARAHFSKRDLCRSGVCPLFISWILRRNNTQKNSNR